MLRKKPKQFKLIIKKNIHSFRDILTTMPHAKNPGILAAINSEAVQSVLRRLNIF